MPRSRPPYASEFRRQIVDLARSGRKPEELSREFEPSAQAIRNWVRQADREQDFGPDGLPRVERRIYSGCAERKSSSGKSGRS